MERQVQRLKAVIDIGRNIRDRRTLKVKQPLKELIIFHHDPEYLADVQSLETYVAGELNVVDVVYTSDEAAVGIKYKAFADWPVLGKKLRKDAAKVRNALPNVSSEACKGYVTDGKLEVAGVELITGDLVVTRYVELENQDTYESGTNDDVTILLDIRRHPELESLTLLRSLTSRVNKLRKEAGLRPSDKVTIVYKYDDGEEDVVSKSLAGNEEYLEKQIGGIPIEFAQVGERKIIKEEARTKDAESLDAEERFVLMLAERV